MRSWVLGALFALCGSGAMAQMQCDRDLLVRMAEEVLDRRGDREALFDVFVGGEAAYLLMRYADPDHAALRARLQAGQAYLWTEALFLAERVTRLGAEGIDQWGGDPRDILIDANMSVWRAIMLTDAGRTYFDLIARIMADPERGERYLKVWPHVGGGHFVLTDQPPEVLGAIAAQAEAAGYLVGAGALYALMPEGAYEEFWDRVKGSVYPDLDRVSPKRIIFHRGFALVRDLPVAELDRDNDPEEALLWRQLFFLAKASAMEVGSSVLTLMFNAGVDLATLAQVSEAYLQAVADGTITLDRRPEESWVWLLAELRNTLGPARAEKALLRFSMDADQRHYSGTLLTVLETATAAEAAGPWLRGETAAAPEKPQALSDAFDWDGALSIWRALKGEGSVSVKGPQATLAIEGLIQQGKIDAALAMAETSAGVRGRLNLAMDVMLRQNRLCDRHGILPGLSGDGGILRLVYDFQ